MSELGAGREFDLIRSFLANTHKHEHPLLRVGPGDDCAVIGNIAISIDMSVEDVHFKRAWLEPREIGYRAAVAAMSDLAAVAATPVAALVSFAVRAQDVGEWAQAVMQGCSNAVEANGAVLAGGDLTRVPSSAALDVVVLGTVDQPVLRSGARTGDELWVTGALGGAAAAVAAWSKGDTPSAAARARYARPVARIREALWLRQQVHAMIDLSDGLAGDAAHIAAASRCQVVLDAECVPMHPDADARLALQGGEDYELCFTASPGTVARVRAAFEREFALPLTKVGDVADGAGVVIRNFDGAGGFDHFARSAT